MSAPLTPPDGSALQVIPAGRYAVQVNVGTAQTPDWVFVNGLTSFGANYEPVLEDDSDITGDGWASQAVAGNAFTVPFEGLVKGEGDDSTFTPDPGMTAIVEASKQTGSSAHLHVRHWRTDNYPEALEYHAAVSATLTPGKPNELQKFSGTLTGRGKPKEITKPVATPGS